MASSSTNRDCLSCRVRVTFSERGQRFFETLAAREPLLPYTPAGEIVFDVLLDDRRLRLTMRSSSGAPRWTIVREAGTRAASLWDHEKKFSLNLPQEDVPRVQVAPALTCRADS